MSYLVKINDLAVDLPADAKVQLSMPSPYLLYDRVEGTKANFPALPFTPTNQKAFGWWQEPQAGGQVLEYRCTQYYSAEMLTDG